MKRRKSYVFNSGCVFIEAFGAVFGQIEQLVDDPEIKRGVQEAFSLVAEKLGPPPEQKQEVINKIEQRVDLHVEYIREAATTFTTGSWTGTK